MSVSSAAPPGCRYVQVSNSCSTSADARCDAWEDEGDGTGKEVRKRMAAAVRRWSGREARALRVALRFSVRRFAEYLGVAPRTISKWEAGGVDHIPRPDTQAILDIALTRADDSERTRFELLCHSTGIRSPAALDGLELPLHGLPTSESVFVTSGA